MNAAKLLDLWEECASATPAERGAAMLAFAGLDPRAVTVGGREAALARLHGDLFGSAMAGLAACPHCGETVEVSLPVAALMGDPSAPAEFEVVDGEWRLRARTLSAADLAAISRIADHSEAEQMLLRRALVSIERNGEAADQADVPEAVGDLVIQGLAALDPLAEISLNLTCPSCESAFERAFDPPSFVWAKLDHWASRMLREVHVLARHYGWSEQAILSMSPARRAAYLEVIAT